MIHTETVHPSQLRRAMAAYAAQGYPPHYGPHPALPGMMVIVIAVPDDTPVPDWQYAPQPQRRRWWPRVDVPRMARGLALAVIAVALAYIAYGMFTGVAVGVPQAPQAAPAIEMPWAAAGRQVGETVDGIVRILTAGFVAALVAVMVAVALKVRKMVGK